MTRWLLQVTPLRNCEEAKVIYKTHTSLLGILPKIYFCCRPKSYTNQAFIQNCARRRWRKCPFKNFLKGCLNALFSRNSHELQKSTIFGWNTNTRNRDWQRVLFESRWHRCDPELLLLENKRCSLRSQKWLKNVSSNHCRLKYDQGEGKFPTLVEVCEGESIKKQRRESTRRELFFYEFTMLEIL